MDWNAGMDLTRLTNVASNCLYAYLQAILASTDFLFVPFS